MKVIQFHKFKKSNEICLKNSDNFILHFVACCSTLFHAVYKVCNVLNWALRLLVNMEKVAFSYASGLNGDFGPHSSNVTLVFHKKITDVGKAFSPITGVFTAPLEGVYYFRFNLLGCSSSHRLAVCLYKNEMKILDVTKHPKGEYTYAIGGVTLLLQKGDHVYIKLREQSQVFDNSDNHCTFSGFLLFSIHYK
uniref:C1q domain-containing protein n=1 Tax=Pygocentrus nattereri TaxID=42514 RepID=A0A3B4D8P5_PYGNA